jgi:hypothetical protein
VLGHLDDGVLMRLGVTLARRRIRREVLAESRRRVERAAPAPRDRRIGALFLLLRVWRLSLPYAPRSSSSSAAEPVLAAGGARRYIRRVGVSPGAIRPGRPRATCQVARPPSREPNR